MTIIMKSEPTPSDREVLTGLVERVTYQNAENGFCVLRVKARGRRELVTLVGHAAAISAGEWITATGSWVNDRIHGQQFKARFLKTSAPTSVEGIEKYLASGMIRGIGPVYAKKLLHAFGEKVFDVIEAEPDRLREVDGIGSVRAGRITAAWAEQKVVREIMVFLHTHGVGTARAVRIYKTYGGDAVQVISEWSARKRRSPLLCATSQELRPSVTKSETVRSRRPREHLTEAEIDKLMAVAKQSGRYGHRDATAILLAYRHGLRASELVELQWDQIDFVRKTIRVRRVKNGDASTHYLGNSELRALRALRRDHPDGRDVFVSEIASMPLTDSPK